MKDKVEKLVAAHFGLGKVHEDDDLITDLGGDALDVIELVMELEEAFNIQISDEEADHIRTIQDAYNCVVAKLPNLLQA